MTTTESTNIPDLTPAQLDSILEWYSGKAQQNLLAQALPALRASVQAGAWIPKASRMVPAALSKQPVAVKFARANERDHRVRSAQANIGRACAGLLDDVYRDRVKWYEPGPKGGDLVHVMTFGLFRAAPRLLATCEELRPLVTNSAEETALATARRWCEAMAPLASICGELDLRRPPRRVVFGTLSPLVAEHLGAKLDLKLDTVRSPKMVMEWVTRTFKKAGHLVAEKVQVIRILWPEGTIHSSSRFATDGQHCEACGHAIRDPFNWLPVLIDDQASIPHSFWIGRDCARRLFGATVDGDALYER